MLLGQQNIVMAAASVICTQSELQHVFSPGSLDAQVLHVLRTIPKRRESRISYEVFVSAN
jgi:hypothetical protein